MKAYHKTHSKNVQSILTFGLLKKISSSNIDPGGVIYLSPAQATCARCNTRYEFGTGKYRPEFYKPFLCDKCNKYDLSNFKIYSYFPNY